MTLNYISILKDSVMNSKELELRKYKKIALLCLLVMVAIFFVAVYFRIDWLKAFAEAAMVGGLADWFAVSALFRKPLGIPFLHSNIIANNKDSIAKSIGVFLKDEFLNKDSLRNSEFINQKINTKALIEDFMNGKIEALSMYKFFAFIKNTALPKVFLHIKKNKNEITKILQLEKVDFAEFLEKLFIMLKDSPYKDEIVDEIVGALLVKLHHYKNKIRNELTDGVGKKFLAKLTGYDDKVIEGMWKYLRNLINHSDENRKEFVAEIEHFIADNLKDPRKRQNLNKKISSALDSKVVSKIIEALADGLESNKNLRKFIFDFIENKLRDFIADECKMKAIDRWIRGKIINILTEKGVHIADYVEQTIKSWEAKEISNKLELEIGKDLQFIRLNGTFIGGILGLGIYGVNVIMELIF